MKFDTFHPAVERGLPVTRVVNRVKLQVLTFAHLISCSCLISGVAPAVRIKTHLVQDTSRESVAFTSSLGCFQEILAAAVQRLAGENIIQGGSYVVDFEDKKSDNKGVSVILEDGRRYEGDVLLGADGIWSKVRYWGNA